MKSIIALVLAATFAMPAFSQDKAPEQRTISAEEAIANETVAILRQQLSDALLRAANLEARLRVAGQIEQQKLKEAEAKKESPVKK